MCGVGSFVQDVVIGSLFVVVESYCVVNEMMLVGDEVMDEVSFFIKSG